MSLRRFCGRVDIAAQAYIDRWRESIQPMVRVKKEFLAFIIPQQLIDRFPAWFPNAMSSCRIILMPCIVRSILIKDFWWAVGLFGFAALLDITDGEWARRKNAVSTVGKLLDPFADKVLFLPVFVLVGYDVLPAVLFWGIITPELLLFGFGAVGWLQQKGKLTHYRKRKLGANTAGKLKGFAEVIGIFCLFAQQLALAQVAFVAAIIFAGCSLFGHFFIIETRDRH